MSNLISRCAGTNGEWLGPCTSHRVNIMGNLYRTIISKLKLVAQKSKENIAHRE